MCLGVNSFAYECSPQLVSMMKLPPSYRGPLFECLRNSHPALLTTRKTAWTIRLLGVPNCRKSESLHASHVLWVSFTVTDFSSAFAQGMQHETGVLIQATQPISLFSDSEHFVSNIPTVSLLQECIFATKTVIPRLTKIIRSGITFVSRNLR